MTGRDMRTFVTTQRSPHTGSLVIRMKNGIGSSKYKPVDYQQLRAEAEAKKLASTSIQLKIKKAQHACKVTKDQTLIKQHSPVWWKEHNRLQESREKLESELQMFLEEKSMTCPFFADMSDLEQQLSEERAGYKACTVHPIWQLRDDLKHRIHELRNHSLQQTDLENDFDPENIILQVESVKAQQRVLIEKMTLEQQALEHELSECDIQECVHSEDIADELMEIPIILQEIDCPYPDLKSSLIHEYQELAELYNGKMKELEIHLKDIDRNCIWTKEEHWIFNSIISQYPCDLSHRRALYLDMLSRHLPSKPRQELVSHEKIWDLNHFTKNQRRVLMESWSRYKKDFVMKAILTITEACSAYEAEVILTNDRLRQQEICTELKEKVTQWRAHQEEAAKLESAIAARKRQEEEQRERQRLAKEKQHRANEKDKIQKYKEEKQQVWGELQRRDLERLEHLKKIMAHQAEKDRERVIYRQQLLENRLLERKEMAIHEEELEMEREKRLAALRHQVAVIAEFDPVRMMGDTKAWRARMAIGNEEVVLQKPLFELHTYTEQQIISDPRIRVEMALRKAGLHRTVYAQEILPQILPPKPPRRDMASNVFKK